MEFFFHMAAASCKAATDVVDCFHRIVPLDLSVYAVASGHILEKRYIWIGLMIDGPKMQMGYLSPSLYRTTDF